MSILFSKFIALSSTSESSTHLKKLGVLAHLQPQEEWGQGGKVTPGVHWPSILAKKASSCFNKRRCLKKEARQRAAMTSKSHLTSDFVCKHTGEHTYTQSNMHIHTKSSTQSTFRSYVSVISCHSLRTLGLIISKSGRLPETKNICAFLP